MQHIQDIIAERNGEIIEYARQKYGNRFDLSQFADAAGGWFNEEYPYDQDPNKYHSFKYRNLKVRDAAILWYMSKYNGQTFTHPCTLLAPELRQHVENGEFGKCLPAFVVHGVNRAKINALEAVWVQYHNELKNYEGQTPGYPMPDDRTLYFAGQFERASQICLEIIENQFT